MLMNSFAALLAGFALNIILGSPPSFLDPERSVPRFTSALERKLKRHYQETSEAHFMAGTVMLFCTLLVFAVIPAALVWFLYEPAPLLSLLLDCCLAWASFSVVRTRIGLDRVARSLRVNRTDLARNDLSKLMGIDCTDMEEDEIIRRSVELAADCTADNAAGALFFTALFGGIGGIIYRTVSIIRRTYCTRSDQSDGFGRAAHDLWVVLDFIPAHAAAFLSTVAAEVYSFNTEHCFEIFKRDRRVPAASNLAPCRCTYAGALGIALQPRSILDGGNVRFLVVGDERHPISCEDVYCASEIMFLTSFLLLLLFGALKVTLMIIFL